MCIGIIGVWYLMFQLFLNHVIYDKYYGYDSGIINIVTSELKTKINIVFRKSKPAHYECTGLLFLRHQSQLTPSTRVCWQKQLWISKTSLCRFWVRFLYLYQLKQNKDTRWTGRNILNLIIKEENNHIRNDSNVNVSLALNVRKLSVVHFFWINNTIERDWCCNGYGNALGYCWLKTI